MAQIHTNSSIKHLKDHPLTYLAKINQDLSRYYVVVLVDEFLIINDHRSSKKAHPFGQHRWHTQNLPCDAMRLACLRTQRLAGPTATSVPFPKRWWLRSGRPHHGGSVGRASPDIRKTMGSTRMMLLVVMLLVDKESLCQVSCCHEVWLTMRHHPVKQLPFSWLNLNLGASSVGGPKTRGNHPFCIQKSEILPWKMAVL